MLSLSRDAFVQWVSGVAHAAPRGSRLAAPLVLRLLSDQLTPVSAYRRLVAEDERTAPSFLLESVENGDRQGRYSIMGSSPTIQVDAGGRRTEVRRAGADAESFDSPDPLGVIRGQTEGLRLIKPEGPRSALPPACALGGWFGFAAYDTARYAEPEKLDPRHAPPDDRGLPDLHFSYHPGVVAFDHVERLAHVVRLVEIPAGASPQQIAALYDAAAAEIERVCRRLESPPPQPSFRLGRLGHEPAVRAALRSNVTRERHAEMVARAKGYIASGDIFQVVLGQRFERRSHADPFDVYRALRTVNPSPYMVYMQCEGVILAASSPEILCRVRRGEDGAMVVTNRPLAGTRRRGATPAEDAAMQAELLADDKERAEHIMLVDLGRNDVGRVCRPGSVRLPAVMEVERYSHVMHISSTVTGELREGLTCWDALRAALPVGTISGAPKIRAMQIIDELEPARRGPYGGGMGYVGFDGQMDIALALRTMVIPTGARAADGAWLYHLQASGGVVADSRADAEYDETVNKAAALARAIDVAETAFVGGSG